MAPVEAGPRPFLSVITVSRDAAATIPLTLDSVAAQTRLDRLEHLVIDGGSHDATCDLVRRAPHPVRLVSEPDRGIYDAMNRGVGLARGEWIAFLNADDAWAHAGVVEELERAAAVHPGVDLFHGDVDLIDAGGRVGRRLRFVPTHDPDSPRARENYGMFGTSLPLSQPATFLRRSVFERIGGFDDELAIAADYDFFLRAWKAGVVMRSLGSVITRMRDDGVSESRPWRRGLEVLLVSRRHGTGAVPAALEFVRFETVWHLDRRAPQLIDALRRVKRALFGRPRGIVTTWTPGSARGHRAS